MNARRSVVPLEAVASRILLLRGEKVILDSDLAELYGVTTRRLNEQVKRNQARFPEDFVFQVSLQEKREVVANCDHLSRLRFSPVLPFAFTEHGAIMAASVLNTPRAVEMGVFVVRAFVRLRTLLSAHKELAVRLAELEHRLSTHDEQIVALFDAIRQLATPPAPPLSRKRIGFQVGEGRGVYRVHRRARP